MDKEGVPAALITTLISVAKNVGANRIVPGAGRGLLSVDESSTIEGCRSRCGARGDGVAISSFWGLT